MNFLGRWRVRKPADDGETVYVSERYGVRSLHIGSDTIQSSMRIARPNELELSYTRSMMAFMLFTPAPENVLMIGLGGGSLAKFCYVHLQSTRIDAVELNPQVLAVARNYFHVPPDDARFRVHIADGATYVERDDVKADVIIVDGYSGDAHVEALATRSFYSACRQRLNAGGIMVVNLWSGDKLFNTLLRRIEEAFSSATLCLPAERPGNVAVFAFERAPKPFEWASLTERANALERLHGLEYSRFVESLRKMNRHDELRLHV